MKHTWYALRVESQKEIVISQILRRMHYMAVTPTESVWRFTPKKRRSTEKVREKVRKDYPIMYGYVLIAFPEQVEPNWFNLLSLDIIRSVVSFEGRPMQLDTREVEETLRQWGAGLTAPTIQKFMRTHAEYQVGDTVKVFAGGMDGLQGKVVEITGAEARVLMQLMSSEHVVSVPTQACEKAA